MAEMFWTLDGSGNWTVATVWSTETVPGAADDDAVLGTTGFEIDQSYNVSLTSPISVNSITLTDVTAALLIGGSGAASVATNVDNVAGTLELQDGGTLNVSGTLSNASGTTEQATLDVARAAPSSWPRIDHSLSSSGCAM